MVILNSCFPPVSYYKYFQDCTLIGAHKFGHCLLCLKAFNCNNGKNGAICCVVSIVTDFMHYGTMVL